MRPLLLFVAMILCASPASGSLKDREGSVSRKRFGPTEHHTDVKWVEISKARPRLFKSDAARIAEFERLLNFSEAAYTETMGNLEGSQPMLLPLLDSDDNFEASLLDVRARFDKLIQTRTTDLHPKPVHSAIFAEYIKNIAEVEIDSDLVEYLASDSEFTELVYIASEFKDARDEVRNKLQVSKISMMNERGKFAISIRELIKSFMGLQPLYEKLGLHGRAVRRTWSRLWLLLTDLTDQVRAQKPPMNAEDEPNGHCFSEASLWEKTLAFKREARLSSRRMLDVLESSKAGYNEAFQLSRQLISQFNSFVY